MVADHIDANRDRYGQMAAIANQRLVDLGVPALFDEAP